MALQRIHLEQLALTVDYFTQDNARKLMDLTPEYQRASVWTIEQRRNLVQSLLLGLPIGSVTLNHLGFSGPFIHSVIDGKQRIETVRMFADDQFAVPADWFEPQFVLSTVKIEVDGKTIDGVLFSGLDQREQWSFQNASFPASVARVKGTEAEARIFRLINSGGTAQTEADLANAARVENA